MKRIVGYTEDDVVPPKKVFEVPENCIFDFILHRPPYRIKRCCLGFLRQYLFIPVCVLMGNIFYKSNLKGSIYFIKITIFGISLYNHAFSKNKESSIR